MVTFLLHRLQGEAADPKG